MSDLMLHGVLCMPQDLAMSGELAQHQFYARAQEALQRMTAAEAIISQALNTASVSLDSPEFLNTLRTIAQRHQSQMHTPPAGAPEPLRASDHGRLNELIRSYGNTPALRVQGTGRTRQDVLAEIDHILSENHTQALLYQSDGS